MFSLFNKFKRGFEKTKKLLFGKIGGIFGIKEIDDQTIESLEESLYNADFGIETTTEIIDAIKLAYKKDKKLHSKDAAEIGKTILSRILTNAEPPTDWLKTSSSPQVICLLGINGAGKTTTAAKLAFLLKEQGNNVLLGACDTFRAAANEQINTWAERLNIDIVSSFHGADAAAVAYDAYNAALNRQANALILDTAGRLHTKSHLMDELLKLKRALQKINPQAPHHSWLIIDGSLGTNSIEQAKIFHQKFGLTGLIITKLDGSSRGGAVVGIYRQLNLPIYYVGLGEKPEDLQPFSLEHYLNAIFEEPSSN